MGKMEKWEIWEMGCEKWEMGNGDEKWEMGDMNGPAPDQELKISKLINIFFT